MFEDQQEKHSASQQNYSQIGNQTNVQTPMQYDWIDVVKQQNTKLAQNQERQKQQDQIRKQKYRDILELEINEKEIQKGQIKDIKRQEQEQLEQSMKMVDKYDEEKKIQKKQVERLIQEQNKQLILEKKKIEKDAKHLQVVQSLNSYTQQNLNIQREMDDENEQKIQKQKQFLTQLESQKKQNQDIKNIQRVTKAEEEQNHLNHLTIEEQSRRNDRDKIRYGYTSDKPTVYQQIDNAYKQKEQKIKEFENHFINQGLQEQIQKEKNLQNIMQQGKKQLQSQVDQIVGDQLVQRKQYQADVNHQRNEERMQVDQNYVNYKQAENQRKNNQRDLYQRQNFINQQQQQLKGQIKERQRHMNDNEIKINSDKLPESPFFPKSSSTTMMQNGKTDQFGSSQAKSNLIYLGDYVSYDRQKQLQYVDTDLIQKQPYQNEFYKKTIQEKMNNNPHQNKGQLNSSIPDHTSNSSQNQQLLSNRTNSVANYENNKLYFQQAKFPRQNGFGNIKSPSQPIQIPFNQLDQPQSINQFEPLQQSQQQTIQKQNQSQQFRHSSSPQIQNIPQNYSRQQHQLNNPINNGYSYDNVKNSPPAPPAFFQPQQQQNQQQNRVKQPLQEFPNKSNQNQLQQQQQKLNDQQNIYKQQINSPTYGNSNNNQQRSSTQLMSPNGFYQQLNQNVQSNNTNQNKPPVQNNIPQSPNYNNNNDQGQVNQNNRKFNIKSIQYNNLNNNQDQISSSNRIATDNQIRVYRSPSNINSQTYNFNQINRDYPPSNNSQYSNGLLSNGQNRGNSNALSNSMNFLESRNNIVSSQRQDYNQIRQNNANWAQRGFNIISGNS